MSYAKLVGCRVWCIGYTGKFHYTSLRSFVVSFTGCLCLNKYSSRYRSTYCFRLCPRLRSSVLHGRLPVADISSRSNLRSAQRGDMVVPRTRTQLGRRSFHLAAPVVWNALPVYTSAQHPSVEDNNSELGWKPISSTKPRILWEHVVLRVYFTYLLTYLYRLHGQRLGLQ